MEDFMLACKIGEKIGSQYIVVVPTITKRPNTRSEVEVFEDSIKSLTKLLRLEEIMDEVSL